MKNFYWRGLKDIQQRYNPPSILQGVAYHFASDHYSFKSGNPQSNDGAVKCCAPCMFCDPNGAKHVASALIMITS